LIHKGIREEFALEWTRLCSPGNVADRGVSPVVVLEFESVELGGAQVVEEDIIASCRSGMTRRSLRPLLLSTCSLLLPLSWSSTGENATMVAWSQAPTKTFLPASYASSRTKKVSTLPRGRLKFVLTPSTGSSMSVSLFLLLETFLNDQKRVSPHGETKEPIRVCRNKNLAFLYFQRLLVRYDNACDRGIVYGVDLEVRAKLSALDTHYLLFRSLGILLRLPLEGGVGIGGSTICVQALHCVHAQHT
jgi:hypothetical protein